MTIKPATPPLRTRLRHWLRADTPSLGRAERRYSALGALVGVAICIWLLDGLPAHSYWLLAPMGATAIILFGMSTSPVAQPRAVFGGYVVACAAGLFASSTISSPLLAAGIAVALTLWLMTTLNCLHPPGGALALLFVLDKKSYMTSTTHSLALVAANVALLLLCAAIINNLIPGRRYPHRPAAAEPNVHGTRDRPPLKRTDLDHEDLRSAIASMGSFVDVTEEDLARLYALAMDHAFNRHVGMRCADVMSRDVISVTTEASVAEAWQLLQRHRIKALPVVDGQQRLAGILSLADIFQHWEMNLTREIDAPALRQTRVGELMNPQVMTATPDTPMATLAREAARDGHHHIPVINADRTLAGMVTPVDMIAALYRQRALEAQPT